MIVEPGIDQDRNKYIQIKAETAFEVDWLTEFLGAGVCESWEFAKRNNQQVQIRIPGPPSGRGITRFQLRVK